MKLFTSFFCLMMSSVCFAGSVCGTYAGQSREYDEAFTRVITRYQQGNTYQYVYEIDFGNDVSPRATGGGFPVKIFLNGRTANGSGYEYCTSAGGSLISKDCQDQHISSNPYTVVPALFYYAAYGDHLNGWDGTIQGTDPVANRQGASVAFHFPQKKYSELQFDP